MKRVLMSLFQNSVSFSKGSKSKVAFSKTEVLKKPLIAGFVFLMAVSGLAAQQTGQFSFGGRLGGAVGFNNPGTFDNAVRDHFGSLLSRSHSVVDEPELNFNFAIYFNYAITSRLSAQAELNFMINQGYELILSAPSQRSILIDVNYHSLDIPLLLRYSLIDAPVIFGIQAGPHISIPLGRLEVYEDRDGAAFNERFGIDTSAAFGITAGLFAGFNAGPGRVVGDLRFIFDFNSLDATAFGTRVEFINRRALAATIGYEISF